MIVAEVHAWAERAGGAHGTPYWWGCFQLCRRGGWRWRDFEGALVVITQWIRVLSVRLTEQAAQLGQHPSSTSPRQSSASPRVDERRSAPRVKCKKNSPHTSSKSLAYTSSRPAIFIDFSHSSYPTPHSATDKESHGVRAARAPEGGLQHGPAAARPYKATAPNQAKAWPTTPWRDDAS